MKAFKDTPLQEITLRKYERPYELKGRDLVRKLCLSIGLLQPGDSRDVVVDVLQVLLQAKKQGQYLSSEQVQNLVAENRKNYQLTSQGIAASNVRRQIKRLRDAFLVEKIRNNYRITEFGHLEEVFEEKVIKYLLPSSIDRVKEYLRKVDESFGKQQEAQASTAQAKPPSETT